MEKRKILVVDDEIDNVILLEKRLKALGYEVITAYDGEEAIDKCINECPDLVLLDIMMPKKDGFEVLKILRDNPKTKDIPVIMLTAKAEVSDKVKGFETGAIDYVTKPFDFKELQARIHANLKSQENVEEKIKGEKLMALSTMMEGVAHEIRNPLTVIGGFAKKLIEMTDKSDPKYFFVEAILKEVERLERMIKDIYEFKTMVIKKEETVGLNALVLEVLDSLKSLFNNKSVNLKINLTPEDVTIKCDKKYLFKAIKNIFDNAIDAVGTNGEIYVETMKKDGFFHILIKDNGIGIKPEDLKFIFDPFYTSKMEGTGLGLTTALKVIKEHNGTISIESKKGVGTSVIIEIKI